MKTQFSSTHHAKPQPIRFGRDLNQSQQFDDYLQTLPASERSAIQAAERVYARDLADRLRSEERVFSESMFGYEEHPAGPSARQPGISLFSDFGDWSYRPNRDRSIGANFRTFHGVPAGAAELFRQEAFPTS